MVKKANSIKIKKPLVKIGGLDILMDRYWFRHMKQHLDEISLELPIKEIHDRKDHLLVEFKNAKIATMFRLKYGDRTK